ncbi:putative protease YhbU precursor [Salinivirga cyanobacteriivorans]|uniref:Putative protease YhbU n=1 Tax=Salinivirga cyanobacteriivorans TaxID=1307839 RepID=A0A0S2I037_9BACT|nr:peptidase U32 family protein [Salinivirga cyanobacteriivorans]ALO15643.1 putative protease YhbU precursor [Salinivirga cyanobacteriivorans]
MSNTILYNRTIRRSDIEIMAPAGNFEALQTAIDAGADAVYFGVGHLNMRAHSSANFQIDDLPEVVKRCEAKGVKTYLTVNTVLYDHDLKPTKILMQKAKAAGISALIVSDMAALLYARELGMEVHASTQLNISNTEALKYFSNYVDVAVLARELNLNQVAEIIRNIENQQITGPSGSPLRIEIFVHGALCMAISGKCYLSLHEFNASANRGACMQTCRRSYTLTDNESGYEIGVDNEYLMSPKDLCTIGFLNKILDAGVKVLKIEGRARSPEYVKTVVETYDAAVNAIADGTYDQAKIDGWMSDLKRVFNRGFWDGYYLGQKMGEWSHIYGSQATERKVIVGKITNYFSKIGVAEFKLEAKDLNKDDKILIVGPTTGTIEMTVGELRLDKKPVDHAPQGSYVSIPVPELVRRNDKLYKVVPAKYAKLQ